MPTLLQEVGHVDVRVAASLGGWLAFAYAIAQFACAPIVGGLSDRFGRRAVLLASLIAFALDYTIMALAPTIGVLFIGRLVAGATGASYSAASAAVADITPAAERAKNFGRIGISFGLGFILGPLLGGLVSGLGLRAPFFAAALLAALNVLYGIFFVPETLAREKRRAFSWASANALATLRTIGQQRAIRGLLCALFLWQLAFQALPATWAYFARAGFGWNAAAVGTSLAFSGLMMAIAQGGLVGPIVKRLGERRAAILGLGAGTIAYLWYALATTGWMLYVGMACWALGGLVSPSCNALMSMRLSSDRQGQLQGVVAASFSLSAIIAPLTMTQLFDHVSPAAPWFASALLAAIAIPIISVGAARAPATSVVAAE